MKCLMCAFSTKNLESLKLYIEFYLQLNLVVELTKATEQKSKFFLGSLSWQLVAYTHEERN